MQTSPVLRLISVTWAAINRAGRHPAARLFFFATCALVAMWTALGDAGRLNDFYDAHFLLGYEEHAVRTVLEHGQIPWWDPYSCGGLYSLGNPQTRWAAPTLLVSLLVGSARAASVITFLMLVLGSEGLFRYLRQRTPAPGPAMLIAPAFMLNGYLASAYYLGWIQFFGFALAPWVLYGTRRAMAGDLRGHAIAALAFGFLVGFGGTYATPFVLLFAAFEALACFPRERRVNAWVTWALRGLALAALMAALAWFRIGPILEELARSPRVMAGAPGHSFAKLASMAFGTQPDNPIGFSPGRLYAGLPVLVILAALGIFRRRAWPSAIIFILCVLAATGYHYGSLPFVWLRELPIFDTLRYPERLLFMGAIFYYELVVSGVFLLAWLARRQRWRTGLMLGAVLGSLVLVVSVGAQAVRFDTLSHHIRYVPMPVVTAPPGGFQQARGNRWVAGYFSYAQRGSISCGEAYPVTMSSELRGDLPADEYLIDATAGEVTRTAWSPNALTLNANINKSTTLRVNQNHHPGWRVVAVRDGHPATDVVVRDDQGLIALDLSPGKYELSLRFVPRSGVIGLTTSLAGVLGIGLLLALRRRRAWSEAKGVAWLLAVPLLGFGAAYLLAPDEARSRPPITNPDGSPLLVDALPPDATRLGVTFEQPVELVGSRVLGPDRASQVQVELYFRVTGPVSRAVGVFVHLERDGRHVAHGDHEVLGGSYFFANAPRDVLLRDVVTLDGVQPSPALKVWVGLWNVSGDKQRVGVTGVASGVKNDAGRIDIGGPVRLAP